MITQTKMILPLKETVQKISQKRTQCANYPHKKKQAISKKKQRTKHNFLPQNFGRIIPWRHYIEVETTTKDSHDSAINSFNERVITI